MNVALRFKRIEVKKKKQVLQLELVWYRNVTIKKLQIWLSVSESVRVGIVLMGVVVFTKVRRPVKSERPWTGRVQELSNCTCPWAFAKITIPINFLK